MIPETKIVADIPKCPNCGHDETITQKAWAETHSGEDLNLFCSFRKNAVPLTAQSPQGTLAMPFVKVLLIHEDYCANCGTLWAIRGEVATVSTTDVKKMIQQIQQ